MARKKKSELWVSKLEQTLAGRKVIRGEIIKPAGSRHDNLIFQENTHWAYRFNGSEADILLCDTDGCDARFAYEAALNEHRLKIHAPERDARERAKVEAQEEALRKEAVGETIGGHPVEKVVRGPGGPVLYIK